MIRKLFDAAVKAKLPMGGIVAGVDPEEVWARNDFQGIVYAPQRHASLADVECAVMDGLAGKHVWVRSGFTTFLSGMMGVPDGYAPEWWVSNVTGRKRTEYVKFPTRAEALLAACEALAKE